MQFTVYKKWTKLSITNSVQGWVKLSNLFIWGWPFLQLRGINGRHKRCQSTSKRINLQWIQQQPKLFNWVNWRENRRRGKVCERKYLPRHAIWFSLRLRVLLLLSLKEGTIGQSQDFLRIHGHWTMTIQSSEFTITPIRVSAFNSSEFRFGDFLDLVLQS